MKGIDYLIDKFKQLIYFIFGHNLRPHYKRELTGVIDLKIKYYKCTRCGKKITVTEYKNNQLTSK